MPSISSLINETARSNNSSIGAGSQSPDRREVANRVLGIFDKKRMMRDQRQPLFRDRTLKQYIDDCIKRFVQFKRRPEHKKNWQSNLASSTPNEKLIGVISKLATKGMEAKVMSVDDITKDSFNKERIGNAFLKAAAIKNDDDFQIILEMMEAFEKGTVIGFEDWYYGKRDIKEVTSIDPETGELKFTAKTIKEWNDVRSSLVNIEDFYPGNIYVRPGKIQDMDDCFLRTVMNEDEFDEQFGNYKDADLVKTSTGRLVNESTPFWKNTQDIGNDQIQVIRYFNKKSDEYVIIANDIWINPIGKATVSPLPWNHKRLPFWGGIYQMLDANYFYGRSGIDVLASFCDTKDALLDRILDQMVLAVSKPIITDGKARSALTKGFLQPNNVIETDWTNGRPNIDVLPINDPSPIGITLLNLLQQNLESATVPVQTEAKNITATEAQIVQNATMQLVSLFLSLMETAMRDKNRLRFSNQLQFYTLPMHAKDDELKFKKIVLRNEELMNGKRGTLQIEMVPEVNQNRVLMRSQGIKQMIENIEITPNFVRNWETEIQMVQQSSVKMSETQRQILELNWQKIASELYQDKFNRDAGFDELALVFNKDPNKVKIQQQREQPAGLPGEIEAPEVNLPKGMDLEQMAPAITQ